MDCFWFCLIDTVKLTAWKQVSEGETRGQNGNSAENRVVTDYGQNKVETRHEHAFWKGMKKGSKGGIFQRISNKKGGESINKTPQT